MRFRISTALSFALLPLAAHEAVASGFMVRENSAENVGVVFAGNASRADEAATVFNNPAGMVRFAAPEIEIGAAVVFPSIHFSGWATAAGIIPIQGTEGGQAGQIADAKRQRSTRSHDRAERIKRLGAPKLDGPDLDDLGASFGVEDFEVKRDERQIDHKLSERTG